ncbi:MAG: permease-like cell division protein FtsX [Burkholderiaceae bacterium]|nr:permease-like cell division protein FtsX [Burkholderiaceae bacterium]MDH5208487.1 permease-like cell division protein FtsX [Burkholderiaceae bacterium]
MSLFADQRYAFGRALAMVRDRPLAFLLGVLLAGIALALPLTMASIGWAAWPALSRVQPAPEISVFLAARASPREVEAVKGRLEQLPGITGVMLRPKDAALGELIKKSGFASTPAELGPNPLPDVLIARLGLPVEAEAIERVVAGVRGWPLVEAVRSDLDWYRKLLAIGRLTATGIALVGGLVALLVALILIGTVRLHAGTRVDEVAVLRLVGATPRFIVRPYAYSAALTLLLAAGLAVGAVHLAHAVLRAPLAALTALYGNQFMLPGPEPLFVLAVLIGAALIGWLVGVVGARTALTGR